VRPTISLIGEPQEGQREGVPGLRLLQPGHPEAGTSRGAGRNVGLASLVERSGAAEDRAASSVAQPRTGGTSLSWHGSWTRWRASQVGPVMALKDLVSSGP